MRDSYRWIVLGALSLAMACASDKKPAAPQPAQPESGAAPDSGTGGRKPLRINAHLSEEPGFDLGEALSGHWMSVECQKGGQTGSMERVLSFKKGQVTESKLLYADEHCLELREVRKVSGSYAELSKGTATSELPEVAGQVIHGRYVSLTKDVSARTQLKSTLFVAPGSSLIAVRPAEQWESGRPESIELKDVLERVSPSNPGFKEMVPSFDCVSGAGMGRLRLSLYLESTGRAVLNSRPDLPSLTVDLNQSRESSLSIVSDHTGAEPREVRVSKVSAQLEILRDLSNRSVGAPQWSLERKRSFWTEEAKPADAELVIETSEGEDSQNTLMFRCAAKQ